MTTNSDPERLGARWRTATRPADPGACPPALALDRLARGTTPLAERAALLEHVAACAACGAALAALDALKAHDRELTVATPRRGTTTFALAVAAAIVLALGAVFWLPRLAVPPDATTTLRGAIVGAALEPIARAQLTVAPPRLRWQGSDHPVPARVRLLASDGSELWMSPVVRDAVVELPDELRAQLDAGGSYAWEVLPDGESIAALGPFWFTVER